MTTTPNLGVTLIEQSQAQKEVTANAAFTRIDAVESGIIDKDLATPPGSPVDGDAYIVAASATGAWAGKDEQIAYYSSGWQFIAPQEGMTLWLNDEDLLYTYDGSDWVATIGYNHIDMQFNTMSNVVLQKYSEKEVAVTAAATTTLDVANGNVFRLSQAVDITTMIFDNPSSSGSASNIRLIRVKDSTATARAITWPTEVKWAGGTAPTLTQTSGAVDIFSFFTTDAGNTWYGRVFGLDMQ